MKRKMYLCVLAACVALSASACGNKKTDTPAISTETKKETVSSKTSEETVATEETEETETEATETENPETEEETAVTETETTETETTETASSETESSESAFNVTDITAKIMYAKQPLNTRKGPGLTYDKVSVLKKHEAVTVNGIVETENWYRLDNGSFVSGKYLLDSLPAQTVVKNETTAAQPSETKKEENAAPTETKKEEANTTPSETKKEETNTTPSETVKPSEPVVTPSEPVQTPSEPTTPSEPAQPSTPETPSEPAASEPVETPSEPEVTVCEHKNTHLEYNPGNYITDREATCSSDGHAHRVCNDCGEILGGEKIPATGNHDWDAKVVSESTCWYTGTMRYTCKACGDWYEVDIPINPDNHQEGDICDGCEEEPDHKHCHGCWKNLD